MVDSKMLQEAEVPISSIKSIIASDTACYDISKRLKVEKTGNHAYAFGSDEAVLADASPMKWKWMSDLGGM
jgi:hypothetical protein